MYDGDQEGDHRLLEQRRRSSFAKAVEHFGLRRVMSASTAGRAHRSRTAKRRVGSVREGLTTRETSRHHEGGGVVLRQRC